MRGLSRSRMRVRERAYSHRSNYNGNENVGNVVRVEDRRGLRMHENAF